MKQIVDIGPMTMDIDPSRKNAVCIISAKVHKMADILSGKRGAGEDMAFSLDQHELQVLHEEVGRALGNIKKKEGG